MANIAPGSQISIQIEYQQDVVVDDGRYSVRFPMVVGSRYIPGKPVSFASASGMGWSKNTDAVLDTSRITPPVLHPDLGKINPVNISVNLEAGFEVGSLDSPYYKVAVTKSGTTGYKVSLADW